MANRKSIQQNIQHISGKITEFNADLQSRKELSVLDIDLLRKHVIDLYDEVNHLRLVMKDKVEVEVEVEVEEEKNHQNQKPVPAEDLAKENETQNTEPLTQNLEALSKAENQVEAEAEVEAMVEAIVEEKLPDDAVTQNPIPNPQSPIPNTQNPEIKLAAAEAKAEADAIKAALNPEEANDLAFKFSNTPIHDLKKAISIAEKFEFINSLFGGNVEKYAYSIHHLNNLDNGDEAFTYLHDLRMEWKWDDEDKNFQKLANLIRRRFLG